MKLFKRCLCVFNFFVIGWSLAMIIGFKIILASNTKSDKNLFMFIIILFSLLIGVIYSLNIKDDNKFILNKKNIVITSLMIVLVILSGILMSWVHNNQNFIDWYIRYDNYLRLGIKGTIRHIKWTGWDSVPYLIIECLILVVINNVLAYFVIKKK